MDAPLSDTDITDMAAAFVLTARFWRALADDDDEAAGQLLYPQSRQNLGFDDVGIAARLRDLWHVTVEECHSMGQSTTLRRDRWGHWGVFGMPVWRASMVGAGASGWAVWTYHDQDGRWWIWGPATDDDWAAADACTIPPDRLAGGDPGPLQ